MYLFFEILLAGFDLDGRQLIPKRCARKGLVRKLQLAWIKTDQDRICPSDRRLQGELAGHVTMRI